MDGAGCPYLGFQQTPDLQLQADAEKQQGNTQIGDDLKRFSPLDAHTVQHKTGDQETDQGRQPYLAGAESQ